MANIDVKSPKRQSEDQLVKKFLAGDVQAFRNIYDRYFPYVALLAYRMTENAHHTEELCQEIFIKLWEKRHRFRGKSSFKTWLYRLAVNTIFDYFRTSNRQPDLVPADNYSTELVHTSVEVENNMMLEEALLKLPVMERLILIMHDVNGWKHKEIAGLIGISPNTSKVHLHNARKKMRKMLS